MFPRTQTIVTWVVSHSADSTHSSVDVTTYLFHTAMRAPTPRPTLPPAPRSELLSRRLYHANR